jgi:hypothetical protein
MDRPARSPHEAVNMGRTPTTTIIAPCVFETRVGGEPVQDNGRKPTDRGVRSGGVRRKPRCRVGASLPITAYWGNAWGTTGSSRAAIATSTRPLASHARTRHAIRQAFLPKPIAKPPSPITRSSTNSAIRSKTCSGASKTGGASTPDTTVAPIPPSRQSASPQPSYSGCNQ